MLFVVQFQVGEVLLRSMISEVAVGWQPVQFPATTATTWPTGHSAS